MPKKKDRRSYCPISYVLDILGDRWTLLIIRDLLIFGKCTFGEMAASDEKIATNILTDRLKLLEEEGIVSKARDEEKGSRFIYSITKKGIDLLPMLVEMIRWSATYDSDTKVPAEILTVLKNERENFINQILEALDKNQYLLSDMLGGNR